MISASLSYDTVYVTIICTLSTLINRTMKHICVWFLVLCFTMAVHGNNDCHLKDMLMCSDLLGSTKFSDLVNQAGGDVLNTFQFGDGKVTLLLPSRVALDNIPAQVQDTLNDNKTYLTDVLYHHLVPERITCNNLTDGTFLDTIQGSKVRFNKYESENSSTVTFDGGEYENVEDRARNGFVCVIDKFLYQFPATNIFNYVSSNQNITTFLLLASKAQILESLKGPNLTLLVPNNAAFAKLAPGVLNNITSNPMLLKEVISNHVANKVMFAEGLVFTSKFPANSGKSFEVERYERDIHIGGAIVTDVDLLMTNGVLHIIDSVLT